jgi:hypothetical protein
MAIQQQTFGSYRNFQLLDLAFLAKPIQPEIA